MSFAVDLQRFNLKVHDREQRIFTGSVDAVHESIQSGRPETGSRGQPVDTGNLRASWQKRFDSPTQATISTNVVYAPPIEDGVGPHGPLTLRSSVGGFHSVKLTVANFDQLVEAEARKVTD